MYEFGGVTSWEHLNVCQGVNELTLCVYAVFTNGHSPSLPLPDTHK